MNDLIESVLVTMQDLKAKMDKWVFPPPSDFDSPGMDPGDECDCDQCRARAQLDTLYEHLRYQRLLHL